VYGVIVRRTHPEWSAYVLRSLGLGRLAPPASPAFGAGDAAAPLARRA
jgi:hypothetical protein